jgi:hypothetical protein
VHFSINSFLSGLLGPLWLWRIKGYHMQKVNVKFQGHSEQSSVIPTVLHKFPYGSSLRDLQQLPRRGMELGDLIFQLISFTVLHVILGCLIAL